MTVASRPVPTSYAPPAIVRRETSDDRIIALDVLRGVAILAIFIVNFSHGVRGPSSKLDHAAIWFNEFFISGSFFPLFSLLFGMGFAVQLARAESAGASFTARYVRRCAALLLIGTAHYTLLLGNGDILRPYAVFGVTLLLFRRFRPTTLLVIACLSLVISLRWGSFDHLGEWIQHRGNPVTAVATSSASPQAPANANPRRRPVLPYAKRVARQWRASIGSAQYRDILYSDTDPPIIFAMFLLGLYAGRRGILRDPRAHRALLLRVLVVAGTFGLVGKFMALLVPAIQAGQLAFLSQISRLRFWGAGWPILSLAYAAAGFLIVESIGERHKIVAWLANVGRMALSIYLLETLVAVILLPLAWPGWQTHFTASSLIGFKMLLMVVFVILASLWMRRFVYGPVEWLWRSITYWRIAPLRRASVATSLGT